MYYKEVFLDLSVYTSPLQILMKKHCIQYHKFADDLQEYVTYSPNLLGDHEHRHEATH